ncbi:hypothetical protein OVA24_02795 [Luteolibacter sp. SL250]|uniref:hypothetical protein n=1 Tax=Luteolibacter sp. SL250 TaxID=2995170 RepID=UPI00226E137B|nr:hypothetical protein [Luteolibacter sp. SL250]WAC20306.1 hypothetical protein OVA24_02795 [Luteolibacter sp. SL250]
MRSALPALLLLLLPGLLAAQEAPRSGSVRSLLPGKPDAEDPSPIPAISLLPEGSILEKVMFPRYDRYRKLTSVLRCEEMTLVSSEVISGKKVSIEAFNPDRSVKGRLNLMKAVYDQKKSLLHADEKVVITSERVVAEGTGLIYALDRHKGFLKGPATTTISNPPSTAMNSSRPKFRVTALLGAAILPLAAQTPKAPGPLPDDAAPMAADAAEATKNARGDLRSILQASEEANKATARFLEEADLLAANDAAPAGKVELPSPPEIKAGDEATIINCDGGIYLDPDLTPTSAVLVYLKGVTVKNPQINLKGANELKVFFDRKPEDPDKPKKTPAADAGKKDEKGNFGGVNLGDPRKIVATGAVVIEIPGRDGKEPIMASASYFSYDLVTGDIVLRGGRAWIIQGANRMRAMDPNAGIYIKKDMTFTTDNSPFEQMLSTPKKK